MSGLVGLAIITSSFEFSSNKMSFNQNKLNEHQSNAIILLTLQLAVKPVKTLLLDLVKKPGVRFKHMVYNMYNDYCYNSK